MSVREIIKADLAKRGPTTFNKSVPYDRDVHAGKKSYYYHGEKLVDLRVGWGDLTRKEKRNQILGSVIKLGLSVVLLGGAQAAIGTTGEPLSDEAMNREAATAGTNAYLAQTALGKYEMSYVDPRVLNIRTQSPGGSGILGYKNANTSDYMYGQACLDGTAYSTRPSEIRGRASGDISAVASLAASVDGISVHPAGSNAPALSFTFDGGELVPNAATARTLKANGCAPNGLVMSTYSDYTSYGETTYVETLHPGQ